VFSSVNLWSICLFLLFSARRFALVSSNLLSSSQRVLSFGNFQIFSILLLFCCSSVLFRDWLKIEVFCNIIFFYFVKKTFISGFVAWHERGGCSTFGAKGFRFFVSKIGKIQIRFLGRSRSEPEQRLRLRRPRFVQRRTRNQVNILYSFETKF
jgi:hypothetical protein